MRPSDPSTASEGDQNERSCPSARCEVGAVLLGIVGRDGRVGYVTPRMTVDAEFVNAAQKGRSAEARFRFSQPCIESHCSQWTGSRCGLIDRVLESPEGSDITKQAQGTLPECVIRPSCRWFSQVGAKACEVCPLVVHTC